MVNGICAIVYCNKEDASRNEIRVLDDFTTSQIYSLSLFTVDQTTILAGFYY